MGSQTVNYYCWGKNSYGQLSIGNNEDLYKPDMNNHLNKIAAEDKKPI